MLLLLGMSLVDEKAKAVQAMFSAIAWRYDFLNRLLSFGVDRAWRREAVRVALEHQPKRILDVATGTADLAIALKKAAHAEVVGVDFAEPMLALGREKVAKKQLHIPLQQGDGQNLEYEDGSFDLVTIAYGIRNFSEPMRGLQEFYRVLAPGGRLLILEFPPPPGGVFGTLFRLYFLKITPYIAGLFSGRRDAYAYLGESVLNFPAPPVLAAMMQDAGFVNIRYKLQTFGVSALHLGEKS